MVRGILVDYEFCTGCHTCEIACAVSHDLPNNRAGVVVHHEGAWEIAKDAWQDTYLPVFTDVCDLCECGTKAHDGVPSETEADAVRPQGRGIAQGSCRKTPRAVVQC